MAARHSTTSLETVRLYNTLLPKDYMISKRALPGLLKHTSFTTIPPSRSLHQHHINPKMSSDSKPITLSSLTFVRPASLAQLLLDPAEKAKIAIIDVRDSDHIGGNIIDSQWIPTNQLDVKIPELLRTLKDKEKVVFHCMLSQQRGPSAALAYARAKQRVEQREAKEAATVGETKEEGGEKKAKQEICVLEGGFGSWQATFGEDPRLTKDYQPDIWL
ncbi:Cdc25 phosphatase Ibp1 [Cladophialophora chaetospira]|uniref:Cdc25 phosphatase Ibp1 n=1 Tax=Cladophialophora chaetospira TaxID=386627 RepID=A0AA39CH14_9EURO|nr:Cdc25 phosphatase Ibp1 [Cladophialophora chaetospira]